MPGVYAFLAHTRELSAVRDLPFSAMAIGAIGVTRYQTPLWHLFKSHGCTAVGG